MTQTSWTNCTLALESVETRLGWLVEHFKVSRNNGLVFIFLNLMEHLSLPQQLYHMIFIGGEGRLSVLIFPKATSVVSSR